MRARWLWLSVPSLTFTLVFVACGSDEETPPGATPDASIPRNDANTTPTPTSTSTNQPSPDAAPDSSGGVDAAVDADAGPPPTSCKALHVQSPSLPSGVYMIDPDGAGAVPAQPAYCDMVFDGGGWTLILSVIADHAINNPKDAGADASPDAEYLLRPPAPNELGMFKGSFVQPLAMNATQIHVRTPWASDAGADGGAAWITSAALVDGGITKPMANLRALKVLNADSDEAFADWVGPRATAQYLAYDDDGNCTAVNTSKYTSVYWACNNAGGLHLGSGSARWVYVMETTPNEAMEVYVR